MLHKISNLNPLISSKNLNLFDAIKELEILNHKSKEGKKLMSEENLSRRERFKIYREDRLRKAVHSIKLCENMANKSSYEYTEEEARTVIKNIEEALRNLKHAFATSDRSKKKFF